MQNAVRLLTVSLALAVLTLAGTLGVQAQQPPGVAPPPAPAAGSPKIDIEKPEHDFGKVWVGDKLEHTFQVRNAGTAELNILAVKPQCGCTTPSGYPKSIAPGATGDFLFRLNGDRYKGGFATTIDIETNDPARKVTKLTLRAHMQHYIEATPASVLFDKLKPDAGAQMTVTLTNKSDKEIKLSVKPPVDTLPVFKWELKEIAAGKTYQLMVSASPPYRGKYNRHSIEIETGNPAIPPLRILCTAIVPERLDLEPNMLYVPVAQEPRQRQILFTANGDKDVKLLEATVGDPQVTLKTVTRKPGREYEIDLVFPANYAAPSEGTSVTLRTDDAEKPELTVPIRGPATPPTTPPNALAQAQPPTTPPKAPDPTPSSPATYLVGTPAPVVNAATSNGQPVQIGGPSGKVTLLAFYTSQQAAPMIEDLHKRYKDRGVDFLAINLDSRSARMASTEEQVLTHYKASGLSMPMVMDPYQLIGPKYRVTSYPTLVLIGKTGTVEAVHSGFASPYPSALPIQINLLLQGKTRNEFPAVAATPPPPPATQPTATRPVTPPRRESVTELVGKPAPAASVKTSDGKDLKVGAGSGRIQLLAFYASWCGFCKRSMPTVVEKLHKDFKDKGIEVIAINQDEREGPRGKTEAQSMNTYKEWNLSMPVTMDPSHKLGEEYKVRGYPTFVLIGRDGTVEAAHVGAPADFDSTARTEFNLLLQGKNRSAFPAPATPPPTAQQDERNPTSLSGKPAPSATAKTPDGKDLKIGSGNGKVQLLAFYASWCGFCKRAMPGVEQLHKDFKDKGVEVIAISEDGREGPRGRTEEQSLATYKEWNLSMPVTMDPQQKLGSQFKVRGYPTFFIVGASGNVEAVYVGGGEIATGGAKAKLESLLKK